MFTFKKLTFKEISDAISLRGFKLIDKEIKNTKQKLTIEDCQGYFYLIIYKNFLNNNVCKFHVSNPYTIQNIKLWCELNNKPFKLLSSTYEGNKKYLQWQCLKENCREIFEMKWNAADSGDGCGYCRGLKVGLSNCLATKNPRKASEWHPTRNGELTPFLVTHSSHKEVWWQCLKNPKHQWPATINSRKDRGCPYCSGVLPSEDYNLLVINPTLCEDWDYTKNDKNPEEYCPNSGKYAWWVCKECDHEWYALISSRNNNRGCPECSKSKGEKECKRVFISKSFIEISQEDYANLSFSDKNNNLYLIPQKTFDGLLGLGNGSLSYDFYTPKYNLLVEYQGQYHDGTAYQQTKEEFIIQQEHDRRKKEYTLKNNYNFLEIWYYDFDRIEEILENYLKELSIKDGSFLMSAK